MFHLVAFLLFWPVCLSVPSRQSSWHGRPAIYTDYVTVSACADTTSVKENPWTAILWYDNNFVCGATILEDDLAITAAHCVIGKRNDFFQLYYGRTVQPDAAIPDRGAEQYGGVTGIRAVRIHPNYDINNKYEGSDIAVLKLKKKIHFNDLVKPIQVIPTKSKYTKMLERGAYVKVAGFGQSSGPVHGHTDRDYPTHMQMISQRIVPHQQCNRGTDLQSIGPARDVLCTRGKCGNGKNSNGTSIFKQICPGDSGSGIVGLFQEENEFYLLGVVSYIVTPNQEDCGKSSKPAFSISTRDHRDFIYEEFQLPDPVDCRWGNWAEWTQCSKSCGEGTRTRRRGVEKESKYGGEGCQGDYKQSDQCSNYCPPPIDCMWNSWAVWSSCSKSCEGGTRSRTRSIYEQARYGGRSCEGRGREEGICNTDDCPPEPIDCKWNSWAVWSSCSKSCEGGTRSRTRSIYEQARYGGRSCQGRGREEGICNADDCPPEPIDCKWNSWAAWSSCSKSCEGGTRSRTRSIYQQARYGGRSCQGRGREKGICNTDDCPITPDTGVIPQIDKSCRPGQKCVTKEKCPDVLQKYNDIADLDRSDEKRKMIVKQLKGAICNKKERAFCCKGGEKIQSLGFILPTSVENNGNKPATPPVKVLEPEEPEAWSAWTSCSSTCGGGVQERQRQCTRSNPYECPKQFEQQTRNCNSKPCQEEPSSDKICETVIVTKPTTTTTTPDPTSTTEYSRIRIKTHTSFTFTRKIICRDRK